MARKVRALTIRLWLACGVWLQVSDWDSHLVAVGDLVDREQLVVFLAHVLTAPRVQDLEVFFFKRLVNSKFLKLHKLERIFL